MLRHWSFFRLSWSVFSSKQKIYLLSVKQGSLVSSELSIFYASYSISTVILRTQLRNSFFGLEPYVKTRLLNPSKDSFFSTSLLLFIAGSTSTKSWSTQTSVPSWSGGATTSSAECRRAPSRESMTPGLNPGPQTLDREPTTANKSPTHFDGRGLDFHCKCLLPCSNPSQVKLYSCLHIY